MLVKVVLKDDEAIREERHVIIENLLEFGERRFAGRGAARDVPVSRVEVDSRVIRGYGRPDDRGQPHLRGNGSDSIIDISIWGAEGIWRDTNDILDDLLRPS